MGQLLTASRISLVILLCLVQFVSGDSGSATLHSVVEELVRFRLKVRQFALATGEATKEARRQQLLERQPLLEACDTLRQDLAAHGISIKVSHCHQGPVTMGMTTLRCWHHTNMGEGPSSDIPCADAACEHRYPSCDKKEGDGARAKRTLRWRDLGEGQSQKLVGDCGPRTCVLKHPGPFSSPTPRTEAAHPHGNCWVRGQKTTNLGAEDA